MFDFYKVSFINNYLDSLIPDRFKITYELKTKVRGVLFTQFLFGTVLSIVGLFYWINDHVLHELVLNTGLGLFLIVLVFFINRFNRYESYVNLILTLGYIDLAFFTIKAGGVYADAPFWFALLIAISVFYTNTRYAIFWITTVVFFISSLFYLQINGLGLEHIPVSYTKKATTIFSYYVLLIAIAFSYTRINKRKNKHHLETIAKHKRLLKERDDLMSIIAHDMKSPSRRIEGLISVFDTKNLTQDQKEILKRLNTTANEGKQLIDDLLEAKSFNTQLTIEKVSLNELISDLKIGFLPLSNKKDIRIITRGLRSKIKIETSKSDIKRILDNLLSNAIKFSLNDTRIEIICVQNSSHTSISIQDQGPGFTEQDEKKMYNMFQKLSARPTGGESSSGLGLSIVKNLTDLLKGKIKYVTEVNKGTTFTLVLPNLYPKT